MNIVEKYLTKKQKYITNYSKKISKFLDISDISLWKNKIEFNRTLSIITEEYIKKYFFKDIDSYVLIGDFFDYNISNDKEINQVIYLTIDYYKNVLKVDIESHKKEIYYLSLIVSYGIKIDKTFNYTVKYKKYKAEFKNILKLMKENKVLRVKKNSKKQIDELIKLIKECNDEEEEFFECFNVPEIFNVYKKIGSKENTYFTKYTYLIDKNKFQLEYIDKTFNKEKIDDTFSMISFELLCVMLLKLSSLENSPTFVVRMPERLCNNEQDIKKLNKIFFFPELKNKFQFLIKEKIAIKKPEIVYRLRENGYHICTMMMIDEKSISEVEIIKDESYKYISGNDGFISECELIEQICEKENKI